ncbi:MAG: 3-methyl-2-oxobutanoate hydroxymethyltransferase [Candidatus Bathyarchaeota archaeon]|nr:MAG: 3-methyl-2-oxobutanoate hydroxymethyltransferase [Candidatus Bathyarchaeota archaeon]
MKENRKKITLKKLFRMKARSEKIVWVVLYDWPTARLADQAGVDMVLIGDSVAMTMLGLPNTLPITMNVMLHHAQAVVRGVAGAYIVGDMPFLSYVTPEDAVKNAGAFIRVGCDAVKLEGGAAVASLVRKITDSGISVIGHLGLTPQSVSRLGGYHIQGYDAQSAHTIINDALVLEEAGAVGVLLENVPVEVAELVTKKTSFLTFSIGGGPSTDGQLLLSHDILGFTLGLKPKFAKTYTHVAEQIQLAFQQYSREVKEHQYPSDEYVIHMEKSEIQKLLRNLESSN